MVSVSAVIFVTGLIDVMDKGVKIDQHNKVVLGFPFVYYFRVLRGTPVPKTAYSIHISFDGEYWLMTSYNTNGNP